MAKQRPRFKPVKSTPHVHFFWWDELYYRVMTCNCGISIRAQEIQNYVNIAQRIGKEDNEQEVKP